MSNLKCELFVSAAHCFQDKGNSKPIPATYITAMLGKFDLKVSNESGAKNASIWEIILHPEWDFNIKKFDADLSIVVLDETVEFNDEIQPVCLPQASYDEVTGDGTIVGWGRSSLQKSHDIKPNKLVVPAVNGTYCYTTYHHLARISSNRMFCGGYEDQEKAPCLGDSGGGFYVNESSIWNVRGIISSAIWNRQYGCGINKFSLYTNVARFVEWISKVMEKTNGNVFQAVDFYCFNFG